MKKLMVGLLILVCGSVFAELSIPATRFRKAPIEIVKEYAVDNDPEAQLELALRYYAGHQVPQDASKAFFWMESAANLKDPDAPFLLSRMVAEGIGVEADSEKAEALFAIALAANPEDAEIQAQYATYVEEKEDSPEARAVFIQQCADAGYVPAYIEVYASQAVGLYDQARYDEALPLFQKLLDQGDPASAFYLAEMYSRGLAGLPENHLEAFNLYTIAAKGGFALAQYALAVAFNEGQGTLENAESAAIWYEKSAKNGHREAQYYFATLEFAKAVTAEVKSTFKDVDDEQRRGSSQEYRSKMKSAASFYQKAADQNHRESQYMMGRLYASGEGVSQDFEEAVRYYEMAATGGHDEAGFYLGLMVHAGLGVSQDISTAINLYEKAMEQDVRGAAYYLGNCYRFGVGVKKNAVKGEGYYREKALLGVVEKKGGESVRDAWVREAAREYGLVLWKKALSKEALSEAKSWVGLAFQNGDGLSQELLVEMNIEDRGGDRKRKRHRSKISEHAVDPRADAVRRKRTLNFLPFYLQGDVEDLYPKSDAQKSIVDVQTFRGRSQNVAGDDLWEIFIKYKQPAVRQAVEFRGVLLVGVEFTDRNTEERSWAFGEVRDGGVSFSGGTVRDVSMFMNMTAYPNVNITDWSVVYGHLLEGGLVLAVFDKKGKSSGKSDLGSLYFNNQYSPSIDGLIIETIDIVGSLGNPNFNDKSAPPSRDIPLIPFI